MNIRKTAIAALAVVSVAAATTTFAPTQAEAKGNLLGAVIGGAIIGGIIANANRPYYQPAYQPVYVPTYHWAWQTQYDAYGNPYNVRIKVCS